MGLIPQMDADERSDASPVVAPPWAHRGTDLGRILALSDGVFAFAMTLLVLGLVLPLGSQGSAVRSYLLSSRFLQPLYAYVITFFVISIWWQGHHLTFSYFRAYDRSLIRLNTVFLLFIAILPFATNVLNSAGSDPIGAVFFALIQVGGGASLGAVWLYGSGRGNLVAPGLPIQWKRHITMRVLLPPLVFALSIPVAFVNTSLAEVLWLVVLAIPVLARKQVLHQTNSAA